MSQFLEPSDLDPFTEINPVKAGAMIDDAEEMAKLYAPCITSDDFAMRGPLKAILRGAILRWNEAGTGALQQQTSGPFSASLDTRQERRGMFWPSEITQLQNLCSGGRAAAYTVSMAGPPEDVSTVWPFL